MDMIEHRDTTGLTALPRREILDAPPEPAFDLLAERACRLFGVPIAAVCLGAGDRMRIAGRVGLGRDGIARKGLIDAQAAIGDTPLVVLDAATDARLAANPLVGGAPGIRFWAGAPVVSKEGGRLGTFWIADTVPRQRFGEHDLACLELLVRAAAAEMDALTAARTVALLNDLGTAVDPAASLAAALLACAEAVRRHTAAPALRAFACAGETRTSLLDVGGHGEASPAAKRVARQAVDTGQPARLDDAPGWLGLPVLWQGERLGALAVSATGGALQPRLADILPQLGAQVGRVAERQRALDEMGEMVTRLAQQITLVELTFQHVAQGILVLGDDLSVRACNGRLVELFGLPHDLVRAGAAFPDIVRLLAARGDFGDGEVESIVRERLAAVRQSSPRLLTLRRQNGQVFEVQSAPVPGGSIVVTYTDVTQQRLGEERLQHSQKMAALGQLAGGVAHEFNNLLTVIGGFTRAALARKGDGERVANCLAKVLTATDRAADLAQQMLTFSRRQITAPRVLPLADEVASVVKLLKPLLEANIALDVDIDRDLQVEIDPTQLTQALINLAVNARDAMPEGGLLTIEGRAVELSETFRPKGDVDEVRSGRYACIAVRDTGTGISEEVLGHIFEPFFTTKRASRGTGLGLAMVFGAVKQAGGFIDVDTAPGVGTTFSLYLPAVAAPAAAADSAAEAAVATGSETILVVEDEAQVRELTAMTLRDLGYRVLTAADGLDGLDVLDAHPGAIDLVLSDVVMPGMGGVDLSRALHAADPAVRIAFMSGYAPEFSEQLRPLGHSPVILRKPFSPAGLATFVREALDTAPVIQAA